MFAGHVGAALALGRISRRINPGLLILAALALDLILWVLVLAGIERVDIPPDFARRHYFVFTFPYSHGLVASLGWSALAAGIAWRATRSWESRRAQAAAVVAAAVFSHWILDAVVHVPGLPVAGFGSQRVGLALWDRLPLALSLEIAVAVAGLLLFLAGAGLSRGAAAGLSIVVAVVSVLTVVGMTVAPPPSDMRQPALVSIIMVPLASSIAGWLARRCTPERTQVRPGR
jgi:hypothetical protein